jgi:hypothetical protein
VLFVYWPQASYRRAVRTDPSACVASVTEPWASTLSQVVKREAPETSLSARGCVL